jgi:hypothetical protein
MRYRQTVAEIARRLPHRTRGEVAEVLEVMGEVWLEELRKPKARINVANIGRLHIQIQRVPCRGAVRRHFTARGKVPEYLTRVYCRFDPMQPLQEVCDRLREEV